jgi:hypothetical protein
VIKVIGMAFIQGGHTETRQSHENKIPQLIAEAVIATASSLFPSQQELADPDAPRRIPFPA